MKNYYKLLHLITWNLVAGRVEPLAVFQQPAKAS
jgi:hypothetical protein